MRILKIDIHKFSDWIVDLVEYYVFDNEKMHQSFRIESKEEIQKCLHLKMDELKKEYDIVELDMRTHEENDGTESSVH